MTRCTCDKTYYEKHGMGDERDTTIMEPPLRVPTDFKEITIDNCLIGEIQDLWDRGILTIGCCCGHGVKLRAYIYVTQACERKMLALKYKHCANSMDRYDGMCFFVPKTI